MKHIFVGDIDVRATHLGGDDIRKLFEEVVGNPLSEPEFELDGASHSMRMHTVYSYSTSSGVYSAAASSVPVYYCDKRDCGADCRSEDFGATGEIKKEEKVCIKVTDSEPEGVSGDAICTIKGLSDGLFLAEYIFVAAASSVASPPRPYTVSVGNTTRPPFRIRPAASSSPSTVSSEK
jgi:hypothetical protein